MDENNDLLRKVTSTEERVLAVEGEKKSVVEQLSGIEEEMKERESELTAVNNALRTAEEQREVSGKSNCTRNREFVIGTASARKKVIEGGWLTGPPPHHSSQCFPDRQRERNAWHF